MKSIAFTQAQGGQPSFDLFRLSLSGLRAMMPSGDKPQLNEWQRLGAATRGGAEQRLQLVAENTRKTVERLEALIRLNKGNFGAEIF